MNKLFIHVLTNSYNNYCKSVFIRCRKTRTAIEAIPTNIVEAFALLYIH